MESLLVGAIVAGAIALIAVRAHALSHDGAIAAFVVGTITYATGTLPFTFVLLAFFIPAVALSRVGRVRKKALVDIGKQGPRDAMQVFANGGIATVCALMWALTRDVHWAVAFAGAYAAAAADTWGTEIGTLAKQRPRSILTLRPVATGISGGITLAGTLAEVAGALLLAAVSGLGVSVLIGGVAGALVDSALGATAQELRWCDACERSCETQPHVCGAPTRLIRGVAGISNDVVNFLATAAGAAVAFACG